MLNADNFLDFDHYFKKIAELKPSKLEFQILTDQLLERKFLDETFFSESLSKSNMPITVRELLEAIHTEYLPSQMVSALPFVPMQSQTKGVKAYPLHVAAALGDITAIQQLLKMGISIEQRDELNLTPLQVAAVSGQAQAVSFLISKGANVFAVDGYKFNLSALDLAVMESKATVVDVLIRQGHALGKANVFEMAYVYNVAFGMVWTVALNCESTQSFDQFNAALQTFITIVNTQDPALLEFPSSEKRKNIQEVTGMPATILLEVVASQVSSKDRYDIIISEINKINAQDCAYQTYLDAKSVFHVLPVHGNYKLLYYKSDHGLYWSKITAEGHWGSFTTPMAWKIIEEYIQNKLQSDQVKPIRAAFESVSVIYGNASLYSKESGLFINSQDAYNLYKQGQILLLPTGWDGHFVNIILDPINEYFIVANCGMRFSALTSGANIYKIYNPSNITPELIYSILNNTKQINLELAFKYQLALDKVEGLWQPDQIYGNCAWQSHEPAVEALLYLNFLNQGYQGHTAKLMAHENYLTWDSYQTLTHLENYFNHDPGLGIEALRDILVFNHTSLFTGKSIHPGEYEQAQYIVNVLAQDLYKKDVQSTFLGVFKTAKPELLTLFKEAGFDTKFSNKLETSDIISDEHIIDAQQSIGLDGIDDFFQLEYAVRSFPGFEFILKTDPMLGFESEVRSDWM